LLARAQGASTYGYGGGLDRSMAAEPMSENGKKMQGVVDWINRDPKLFNVIQR